MTEQTDATPQHRGDASPPRRDAWPPDDIEWDPRYQQCSREMRASIIFWIAYTAAVVAPAAWLGYGKSVGEMSFVAGVPAWVFWPSLISLVFCAVVPALLVKLVFRNFSIAPDEGEEA